MVIQYTHVVNVGTVPSTFLVLFWFFLNIAWSDVAMLFLPHQGLVAPGLSLQPTNRVLEFRSFATCGWKKNGEKVFLSNTLLTLKDRGVF